MRVVITQELVEEGEIMGVKVRFQPRGCLGGGEQALGHLDARETGLSTLGCALSVSTLCVRL